jgi:hypothetical protein
MANQMDKITTTNLGSFPENGYQPNTLISSAIMNKVLVELTNVMNGWINFLVDVGKSDYIGTDTIEQLTTKMKSDMTTFKKNCQDEIINTYLCINKDKAKINDFNYKVPSKSDSIFVTDVNYQDFTTIYTNTSSTSYVSFANKGSLRYMCISGDIYVKDKYKVVNESELCTINGVKLNSGSNNNIKLVLASTDKTEVINGGIWFE